MTAHRVLERSLSNQLQQSFRDSRTPSFDGSPVRTIDSGILDVGKRGNGIAEKGQWPSEDLLVNGSNLYGLHPSFATTTRTNIDPPTPSETQWDEQFVIRGSKPTQIDTTDHHLYDAAQTDYGLRENLFAPRQHVCQHPVWSSMESMLSGQRNHLGGEFDCLHLSLSCIIPTDEKSTRPDALSYPQLVILPSSNNLVLRNGRVGSPPNTPGCFSPLLLPHSNNLPANRSFVFPPGPHFPGPLSPNMIGVQSAHRLLSPMAVASSPPTSSSVSPNTNIGSGLASLSVGRNRVVSSTAVPGVPLFTSLPPSVSDSPSKIPPNSVTVPSHF